MLKGSNKKYRIVDMDCMSTYVKNITKIISQCIEIGKFMSKQLEGMPTDVTEIIKNNNKLVNVVTKIIPQNIVKNQFEIYFLLDNLCIIAKKMVNYISDLDGYQPFHTDQKLVLAELSLKMSIQLDQISSLFLDPKNKKIRCEYAQKFWENYFPDSIMVPSKIFSEKYSRILQLFHFYKNKENIKVDDLICAIDITGDGYISIFEFDIFLARYGSFFICGKNYFEAHKNGFMSGPISRIETLHILKKKRPGSFLVRYSTTRLDCFAISFVYKSEIIHCLVEPFANNKLIFSPHKKVYQSISQFIEQYSDKLKYPILKK